MADRQFNVQDVVDLVREKTGWVIPNIVAGIEEVYDRDEGTQKSVTSCLTNMEEMAQRARSWDMLTPREQVEKLSTFEEEKEWHTKELSRLVVKYDVKTQSIVKVRELKTKKPAAKGGDKAGAKAGVKEDADDDMTDVTDATSVASSVASSKASKASKNGIRRAKSNGGAGTPSTPKQRTSVVKRNVSTSWWGMAAKANIGAKDKK